jgi:hypothetical protein
MAAPAITGAAGLIVACHPDFAGKSLPRNAARVDRIFQIVIGLAQSVGLNPLFGGSGLPTLPKDFMPSAIPQQPATALPPTFASGLELALQQAIQQRLVAGFVESLLRQNAGLGPYGSL